MSEERAIDDKSSSSAASFTVEQPDAVLLQADHRSLQTLARIAATSTPAILVLHALTLDEQAAETFFQLKQILESINARVSGQIQVDKQPVKEMLSRLYTAVDALRKELE